MFCNSTFKMNLIFYSLFLELPNISNRYRHSSQMYFYVVYNFVKDPQNSVLFEFEFHRLFVLFNIISFIEFSIMVKTYIYIFIYIHNIFLNDNLPELKGPIKKLLG